MPLKDMTGQVFGLWTVLSFLDVRNENSRWLCRCECGTERAVWGNQLRCGRSTGCGCKRLAASRVRTPHNFADLTAQRFGSLVVVERHGTADKTRATWLCRCDCGGTSVVRTLDLRAGKATTCGCSHGEQHGLSGHPNYVNWYAMISRCTRRADAGYKFYGGRGITVCDRWSGPNGLAAFIEDMGTRPSPDHEIDRIDTNGNYEPNNCRWATRQQQCQNTRRNVFVTHNGETLCLTEWARRAGLAYKTLHHRIFKARWPMDKALSTPSQKSRHVVAS